MALRVGITLLYRSQRLSLCKLSKGFFPFKFLVPLSLYSPVFLNFSPEFWYLIIYSKPMPIPTKRLFVCCDGTGRDSIREKNHYITNVARFARCLRSTTSDGALQLVYYHEGVAMHNGEFQYREATTGQGSLTLCSQRTPKSQKSEPLLTGMLLSRDPRHDSGCVQLPQPKLRF